MGSETSSSRHKHHHQVSDKAAQHLAHALGESVIGGNPGTPYALSHPACITSRCPYKLTYFPGYSLIAIQENSWVGYPGILQRAAAAASRCSWASAFMTL